eukprot:5660413-Alexandrium_andersonii.AAC.1
MRAPRDHGFRSRLRPELRRARAVGRTHRKRECQRPPSPRKGLLVASPGGLPPPGPPRLAPPARAASRGATAPRTTPTGASGAAE